MKIHHVGVVVPSIKDYLHYYTEILGFTQVSPIVHDPVQDVRLTMLADGGGTTGNGAGIELIEPASPASPVAARAAEGGGLAHICYQVDDLDKEINRLRSLGAILVRKAAPAVLFCGKRVAFLFMKGNNLIELVEDNG